MLGSKTRDLILLHFSILLFSATGIFSKLAAGSINKNGILNAASLSFILLMLINCTVYALFWQQNLKKFDVNVAYAHRAAYNVWSLLWAALIFSEKITAGNILGTIFIIAGILVMKSE